MCRALLSLHPAVQSLLSAARVIQESQTQSARISVSFSSLSSNELLPLPASPQVSCDRSCFLHDCFQQEPQALEDPTRSLRSPPAGPSVQHICQRTSLLPLVQMFQRRKIKSTKSLFSKSHTAVFSFSPFPVKKIFF